VEMLVTLVTIVIASLLIDLVKTAGTIVAVIALFFVFPFVMIWFLKRIGLGTPKGSAATIRKVR